MIMIGISAAVLLGTGILLNFQPPLPLNGNLRNTSYMKQIPNYEL